MIRSAKPEPTENKSLVKSFFSVLSDNRAWGALLYLLLSFISGNVYFVWTVTALSLSLGLVVLIIGLPLAVLAVLSIRWLAHIEGRIIEALLGVRMPRRGLFTDRAAGWRDQITSLFVERRTWSAVAYLLLQLPLGVLYFALFTLLLAFSLSLMVSPIVEILFNLPLVRLGDAAYHLRIWQMPLVVVGGLLLFIVTLHLAKFIGRVHATLARTLLVDVKGLY